MSNEQQQIIGDAYKNYLFNSEWFPISSVNGGFIGTKSDSDEIMTQDLFINKCKTDSEFSEKWVLQIEERELSLEERHSMVSRITDKKTPTDLEGKEWIVVDNIPYKIPRKLITITYKDTSIESYE